MIEPALIIIFGPLYLYVVARLLAAAAARSYFEIKREFSKTNKEEV
ncbi:MAG: hypothetical protein WC346_00030 [Methanogenium sp.]|jgi:hypothetical protein